MGGLISSGRADMLNGDRRGSQAVEGEREERRPQRKGSASSCCCLSSACWPRRGWERRAVSRRKRW
jgi:hypothetical protein